MTAARLAIAPDQRFFRRFQKQEVEGDAAAIECLERGERIAERASDARIERQG